MRKLAKNTSLSLIIISIILYLSSFTIEYVKNITDNIIITEKIANEEYYAIIDIPKISLKKELYNNDLNNVDKNIFIHEASIFPNSSNDSNIILAAHSGNGSNTYFKNLYKLNKGDIVNIYYHNKVYQYEINLIEYQLKTGNLSLLKTNGDNLVLITCTYNDKNHQTIYYASLKNSTNLV